MYVGKHGKTAAVNAQTAHWIRNQLPNQRNIVIAVECIDPEKFFVRAVEEVSEALSLICEVERVNPTTLRVSDQFYSILVTFKNA